MGYFSQVDLKEAYIHFLAVHPDMRRAGIGQFLYEKFFDFCKDHGRIFIRSCTAPINVTSIAFHTRMGFQIESGDSEINGFLVTRDYYGKDDHKVLFVKDLA